MTILIEIHCETKSDAINHLYQIKRQIKGEFRVNGDLSGIEEDFRLDDSNCYGEHEVLGYIDDNVQMAIDFSDVNNTQQ